MGVVGVVAQLTAELLRGGAHPPRVAGAPQAPDPLESQKIRVAEARTEASRRQGQWTTLWACRRSITTVRFEGQPPPFGQAGPCGVTSVRGSFGLP